MRPLGRKDPASIGPYRLIGVLGTGGMGRVYLGESAAGRRLAIKVIRPDLAEDPTFRARFAREVNAARSVNPLFTAAVVDADTDTAEPWLATTYIDGTSLERRVADDGPLSVEDALTLATGLAEALRSIHAVGLVHRDFKPSNILLTDTGPHIIDFGLALGATDVRMTTSLVVGTPSYMAPERLRGDDAGPASDIFSFGATIVYASTGHELVDDGTVYEQVLQIAEGRYRLENVPRRLRALVIRCVNYESFGRPTADELLRILIAMGRTATDDGFGGVVEPVAAPPAPATRANPVIRQRRPVDSVDGAGDTRSGRRTTVGAPRIGSGTTRRVLLGTGFGVLGAAAIGGVAAAMSGVFSGAPPTTPLPLDTTASPGDSSPTASAAPSTLVGPPVTGGSVLWRAASAPTAGSLGTNPATTSSTRVVIGPDDRVITATTAGLVATDGTGRAVWQRPLSGVVSGLWPWGTDALATDGTHAWLVDGEGGGIVHTWSPIDLAAGALRGSGAAASVGPWAATSATVAYVGVDRVRVALRRDDRKSWATDSGGPFEALAADARYLAGRMRQQQLLLRTEDVLVDASNGKQLWKLPAHNDQGAIQPGQALPPLGGPADPAMVAGEAHIGPSWVAIRDGSAVRVRDLASGTVRWHMSPPAGVTAMVATDDLVVVAADLVRAYGARSGHLAWTAPYAGARLAVSTDPAMILIATRAEIVAYSLNRQLIWRASMPSALAGVPLDRLIVANRRAYLTFAGAGVPDSPGGVGPDVIAIALDARSGR